MKLRIKCSNVLCKKKIIYYKWDNIYHVFNDNNYSIDEIYGDGNYECNENDITMILYTNDVTGYCIKHQNHINNGYEEENEDENEWTKDLNHNFQLIKYIYTTKKEINCDECNTKYYPCYYCEINYDDENIFHLKEEMNKWMCLKCYNIIKKWNPSNNNNKFKFDEDKLVWMLDRKKCYECDKFISDPFMFYFDIDNYLEDNLNGNDLYEKFYFMKHFNHNTYYWLYKINIICIDCAIKNIYNVLKEIYKDEYQFKVEISNDKIKSINFKKLIILGKKKCICGELMEWTPVFLNDSYNGDVIKDNKINEKIYQCKNCKPYIDNKNLNYEYNETDKCWDLIDVYGKCGVCNTQINVPFSKNNSVFGIYNYLRLCSKCMPLKKFVRTCYNNKFKINLVGKLKHYDENSKKHIWTGAYQYFDLESSSEKNQIKLAKKISKYRCSCDDCKPKKKKK